MIEDKIPAVVVEFHELPDLVMTKGYYEEIGKWKGFLRLFALSIREIKRLRYKLMYPEDFPINEWLS